MLSDRWPDGPTQGLRQIDPCQEADRAGVWLNQTGRRPQKTQSPSQVKVESGVPAACRGLQPDQHHQPLQSAGGDGMNVTSRAKSFGKRAQNHTFMPLIAAGQPHAGRQPDWLRTNNRQGAAYRPAVALSFSSLFNQRDRREQPLPPGPIRSPSQ